MVVICHICNFYNNELAYWFNCGVQMFLLISGFLYGQRGIISWKAFYKRNLPKILIDYYLYLAIMIPIYLLVIHQSISVSDYINLLFGIGTDIPGMGHLWYISTILVCYLITPFVSQMIYPNPDKPEKVFSGRMKRDKLQKKQRWDSCGAHYREICGRNTRCIDLL